MVEKLHVGSSRIGDGCPAFVIAEIGINHNGDISMALEMVAAANEAGADCVKFQAFQTDANESDRGLKPSYFDGRDGGVSKKDFSRALELSEAEFLRLREACDSLGVLFLSMVADPPSLKQILRVGPPALKIGSSDTDNFPLLRLAAESGLPLILSTGISTMQEVSASVAHLRACGQRELALLQCTSQYPAPCHEINLRVIDTYKDTFGCPAGLSDHSDGIHIPVAAVARGANIIEKHFTLDSSLPGVDHAASLDPVAFATMVRCIRDAEAALGCGTKVITDSEREHLITMRKSIMAACDLPVGTVLEPEHLAIKRPGEGLSPRYADEVVGRRLRRDVSAEDFITWDILDEA